VGALAPRPSNHNGKANSRWILFATMLAVSVLVIGTVSAGFTGYVYSKRGSLLAPLDKVADMLSDPQFIGTVSGVLANLKVKLNSASTLLQSLESGMDDGSDVLTELKSQIDTVSASIPYLEVVEPVQRLIDITGSLPDYVSVPFGPYYDLRDEKQMLYDLGILINETGQDVNTLLGQTKSALSQISSAIDSVDLSAISTSVAGVDLSEVSASIDNIQSWLQDLQGGLTQVSAQLLQLRAYVEIGILLTLGLCLVIVSISIVLIITLRVLNRVSRQQAALEAEKQLIHIEPVPDDAAKGW